MPSTETPAWLLTLLCTCSGCDSGPRRPGPAKSSVCAINNYLVVQVADSLLHPTQTLHGLSARARTSHRVEFMGYESGSQSHSPQFSSWS